MKLGVAFVCGIGLAALPGCDSGSGASSVLPETGGSRPPLAASRTDPAKDPLADPSVAPHVLSFEAELLRLVNTHRASRGLPPFHPSAELQDVARAHSRHMIERGFFGHTDPEGLTPADRMEEAGVEWSGVGENLAAGYGSPQAVFDAWMMSPEHRKNLESEDWTHTGIGYALDTQPADSSSPLHYWTENFLRP